MKKIFMILFVSFFLLWVHYARSGGFRLSKALFPLKREKIEWQESTLRPFQKPLEFTYLGKGRQSYVFENRDLGVVIKIFRNHKYFCPLTLRLKDSLGLVCAKDQKFIDEQNEREDRALLSYRLARTTLFPLTHVTYLHNHLCQPIEGEIFLTDRWSLFRQKIHLEDFCFLVQKKGESLEHLFLKAFHNHDENRVKELLELYRRTTEKRINLKIANRDFQNALRNAGLYQNQVMEMDVGSFYPLTMDPEIEVEHSFASFQSFFQKHGPHLLFLIDESKEKLLKNLHLKKN